MESGKKIHVVLEDHESLGARYTHTIYSATGNAIYSVGRLPPKFIEAVQTNDNDNIYIYTGVLGTQSPIAKLTSVAIARASKMLC